MKRFLIILSLLCVLIAGIAYAAVWHTANQATVSWNAVTTDIDGVTIPAGMLISYEVFVVAHNSQNFMADKISKGTTATTTHTMSLDKGHWYVGVQTIMTDELDSTEVVRSNTISWSNDPLVCENGVDFGLRYYVNPNKADGLRHVGGD